MEGGRLDIRSPEFREDEILCEYDCGSDVVAFEGNASRPGENGGGGGAGGV